jgi:hypothetical protein
VRDDSSRLFLCQRCRDQVTICSYCDRGNRYCRICAPLARSESLRAGLRDFPGDGDGGVAGMRRRYSVAREIPNARHTG